MSINYEYFSLFECGTKIGFASPRENVSRWFEAASQLLKHEKI